MSSRPNDESSASSDEPIEPETNPLEILDPHRQVVDLHSLAQKAAEDMSNLRNTFSDSRPTGATADVKAGYEFLEHQMQNLSDGNSSHFASYPSSDPARLAQADAVRMRASSDAMLARIEGVKKLNESIIELDRKLHLRHSQLRLQRQQLEDQYEIEGFQAKVEIARQRAELERQQLKQKLQDVELEEKLEAATEARDRNARQRLERTAREERDHELNVRAFEIETKSAARRNKARVAALNEQSKRELAKVRKQQFDRLKPRLKVVAWTAAVLVPVSNFIADQPEYSNVFPFSTINNLSDAITEPLLKGLNRSVFGQGPDLGRTHVDSVVAHSDGRLELGGPDRGIARGLV